MPLSDCIGHATVASAAISQPLPAGMPACTLIDGFLSRAECRALIAAAEQRGFAGAGSDYPPSYRNNDRRVLDDALLAERLYARLRPYLADTLVLPAADGTGSRWRPQQLNARLRLCRYRAGQGFGIHQDGVHHRGSALRSCLTFMVYLTDGADFRGGDTLFYDAGPGQPGGPQLVARVRPRAGSVIVFDHRLWHAGEALSAGCKHILRSDILYAAVGPTADRVSGTHFDTAHDGYVWTLAQLGCGRIASGGRDGRIRLWHANGGSAGSLDGHTRSVLGLTELAAGTLASVSRDRSLRIWNLAEGRCTRHRRAHDGAALCLLRLANGLASGGADATIAVWNQAGDGAGRLHGHRGWVWALAAVDANRLASASEDGSVKLWDLARQRCTHTLAAPAPLRALDVTVSSPTRYTIAAGDAAGNLSLWQVDHDQAELVARIAAHRAAIRQVRFLRDGAIASAGEDDCLRIWRADPYRCVQQRDTDAFVTDLLQIDPHRLLHCGYDGRIATLALCRSGHANAADDAPPRYTLAG